MAQVTCLMETPMIGPLGRRNSKCIPSLLAFVLVSHYTFPIMYYIIGCNTAFPSLSVAEADDTPAVPPCRNLYGEAFPHGYSDRNNLAR